MRKLIAAALAASALFVAQPAMAQPKPYIYVACQFNSVNYSTALVGKVITTAPVDFTVSANGSEGAAYYAVFQLSQPESCATLFQDSMSSGPFPGGILIEADTSHKPVFHVM